MSHPLFPYPIHLLVLLENIPACTRLIVLTCRESSLSREPAAPAIRERAYKHDQLTH